MLYKHFGSVIVARNESKKKEEDPLNLIQLRREKDETVILFTLKKYCIR